MNHAGAMARPDPLDNLLIGVGLGESLGHRVDQLIRRDAIITDHLWLRPEFGIERKERVEHHIAVIARHIGGRPHGVEDAQIVAHDEAQGLDIGGSRPGTETKPGEARCTRSHRKITTRHPMSHSRPPPLEVTQKGRSKNRAKGDRDLEPADAP